MKDIYGSYRRLKKNAIGGYWGQRILAELGYLLEVYSVEDEAQWSLLEQAFTMLTKDYDANEGINAQTVREAEQLLLPLAEKAKSNTVICAAHAHIDMNWMWGYQETVALTLDTVRTMLTLMKEYPEFTFSQSQASVYYILEEYAPELLEEVKQRVKEGRWEVTASSWVENDKNMPTGESLARHLLYTKKYLSKLLDIKEESMNLDFEPDTFGHSANVPEVLTKGGVSRYFHCRGYEGENIYRWRGKSGAEVLVYREPKWYNGSIGSDLCKNVPGFCKKYGVAKMLYVYGVGDHGGGPTRRDIERLMDMGSWPLFPVIRFGTYREFYDYLEERKGQFPIVEQELNYVFTGCYTSQSRIKVANRIGEARLIDAETLESMAKLEVPKYQPGKNLEEAWRRILFNQFHDILPGSGKTETREHAMGQFQLALARAGANGVRAMDAICGHIADGIEHVSVKDTAMGAGVGKGTNWDSRYGFTMTERGNGQIRYMALFNVTQTVRTEPTEIILWDWKELPENTKITDMNGKEYPFQVLERGNGQTAYWGHYYCKLLVWMPVQAAGYTICRAEVKEAESIYREPEEYDPRIDDITDEPICLENGKVKVLFDVSAMKCISFIRKADGKELIATAKPACGLTLITEESSDGMSSWRVGRTAASEELNVGGCVWMKKIQTEGLRKELEYEITGEKMKISVSIHLDEGSEFLDFQIRTIWTMLGSVEHGVPQLRFQVPCGYEVENYRYAVPYGIIDRPPIAQDVPAVGLGCAMPRSGGSALCMLSDCKYGFRGDGDGLSLNLIRGSFEPDKSPEFGEQLIRIAVGACDTDEEKLALMAERYIHPVIVRSCGTRPRIEDAGKSLFGVVGAILSAVKEAEDGNGYIIRVYNPSGVDKVMKLYLPGRRIEVCLCDILENDLKRVNTEDDMTQPNSGDDMAQLNTEDDMTQLGTKENVISYTLSKYEVSSFRVIVK